MFITSINILIVSFILLLSSILLSVLNVGAKHKRSVDLSESKELEITYMKSMKGFKNLKDMMADQKLRHQKN